MSFAISGHVKNFEKGSLRNFEKHLGIILSENQPHLQQHIMIRRALQQLGGSVDVLSGLSRQELLSFIFVLTQFGDVTRTETPLEYMQIESIPYVVQWKKGHYMIPLEILEYLSHERIFRDQGYLFALIPSLSIKEKKSWIRWMGVDFEKGGDRDLNFEIYFQCRLLQKPFLGKSLVQESEIEIEQIWPKGKNEYIDWFYKGLSTFYYSMEEMSKQERDPFLVHVIELIKAGKFILKKLPDTYGQESRFSLISTVEGNTPQLRETVFQWEEERIRKDSLF
ncbi:hypothetical protein LPTSP3_g02030 [Leptospira kobayashii]|uniref:Uncharacterized protein n=1 Tax=Leptospira kobayashii TaxID=1917830 RepID=A0ABN6K8Z9_9LEPT|nr:hypothetical protein [Leptospira kobayashii]BDA77273.1 hypothetical protein LPTSP3_g02030 [Leptospira kobayashii]